MKIKEQFNQVSKQYDSERHKLIPCLNDFYQTVIDNLALKTENPEVLDLGAGTGLLSQKVLENYPSVILELVDFSNKMLEVAKERFMGLNNTQVILADYSNFSPKKQYDAVISSLSIHHLPDDKKKALYANILSWLKPGGVFINADQVLAHTPYLEKLYSQQWKKRIEASDLSQEAIDAAYHRVKLDIRTPLNTQLDWLKSMGFNEVDCLYKSYDFVVMYSKKPF